MLYTKLEILETYLNTVPFLYNAFGIEMAARTYFDKSAYDLDVVESATLIGMLKGTSYYNPVLNPERARQRRNLVLAQMAKDGTLDPARLEQLSRQPLGLDFERQVAAPGPAPHVAQQLRKWLIAWADDNDYNVHADGLRVVTTLDAGMQKAANQAVTRQLAQLQRLADGRARPGQERPALQAGFLALDPRDGAVRAWVGSRDFATEQFDHVSQARRQPGSTFKPFVYGAAFMQGFSPTDTFIDQAVAIRPQGGGEVWTPKDETAAQRPADDAARRPGLFQEHHHGPADGQGRSPSASAQLAQSLGVRQSKLDLVPSLALGTSPVTLIEMVTAYASIANGGNYMPPMLVQRVEDRHGKLLAAVRAVEKARTRDAVQGLADAGQRDARRPSTTAPARPSARRYGIRADVAGKTGTTQDNTDGWFIMMHPQLVAGARVGFNDNSVTMGSWGQGARSALPMVGEVFQQALRNKSDRRQGRVRHPAPAAESHLPHRRTSRTPENLLMEIVNEVIEEIWKQLR